jgi:hypothetical protein
VCSSFLLKLYNSQRVVTEKCLRIIKYINNNNCGVIYLIYYRQLLVQMISKFLMSIQFQVALKLQFTPQKGQGKKKKQPKFNSQALLLLCLLSHPQPYPFVLQPL